MSSSTPFAFHFFSSFFSAFFWVWACLAGVVSCVVARRGRLRLVGSILGNASAETLEKKELQRKNTFRICFCFQLELVLQIWIQSDIRFILTKKQIEKKTFQNLHCSKCFVLKYRLRSFFFPARPSRNYCVAERSFTEVSDRALLRWCERSGLARPKTYAVRHQNGEGEE